MKTKKFLFSCQVQGVGFRRQCQFIAKSLNLGGEVKNLKTGKVELILTLTENQQWDFLESLKKNLPGHITDIVISDLDLKPYKNFTIAF